MLGDLTSLFPEISCMPRVQVWDPRASEIHEGWGQHHVETKGTEEKNRFSSVPIKIRNWIDQTFWFSVSLCFMGELISKSWWFGMVLSTHSFGACPRWLREAETEGHSSDHDIGPEPWSLEALMRSTKRSLSSLVEVSKAASLHRFFTASGATKFAEISNLKVPS